jgi:hypothetical protein
MDKAGAPWVGEIEKLIDQLQEIRSFRRSGGNEFSERHSR